ncbi:4-alpha-glucanotransferase [Candidatus Nitromaritima sp. SCGC AAA799-C22]|nr:4-alpha-glucanotransferase [Candidatus Nitromaritima sp. SCGC AAA799-C22]
MIPARKSGLLLHISSLPSAYGIGDLGASAYQFAKFLQESRQNVWQILPLNPTTLGNSPYYSPSAFAFNPYFISPELMVRDGLILESELYPIPNFPGERVDYPSVIEYKNKLFKRGFARFKDAGPDDEYDRFCRENCHWLQDYALFTALKSHFSDSMWCDWPGDIKNREADALQTYSYELQSSVEEEKFLQFIFFRQWTSLKEFCGEKGIAIFGDVPIYTTFDSADLWAHPRIFKLDQDKKPYVVAGVPPDYFSETGQLWGNPVYNWDALKEKRFDWWVRRIKHNLRCFDLLRIDHFRGLVSAWEIPAKDETAENGQWVPVPVVEFLATLLEEVSSSSLIAEDLGHITEDVREVMKRFGFPGMKLLIFAFGEGVDTNPYAPHNHVKNCVVYTATHDCDTMKGWFENDLSREDKERLFRYLEKRVSSDEISWEMVRLAMMSVADTVILPMQDVLALGSSARMNRPGTTEGNWEWRLVAGQLTGELAERLKSLTELCGRG